MLKAYRDHVAERAALGIPPLPLTAKQTGELIELLKNPPAGEEATLVGPDHAPRACRCGRRRQGQGQLPGRRGPRYRGVHADRPRARHASSWAPCWAATTSPPLIDLLDDGGRGLRRRRSAQEDAADVRPVPWTSREKADKGNTFAQGRCCKAGPMPSGSPAAPKCPRASSSPCSRSPAKPTPTTCRPRPTPGAAPTSRCMPWPCSRTSATASRLKMTASAAPSSSSKTCVRVGNLVAYVGDVVGTGSSRKSATNSVLWFTGEDIPVRAQQALRRRVPGQQDRSHLLQHHGRRGRSAHRARCEPDEHGRRDRAAALRRQGIEGRPGRSPNSTVKSEVLFDEVRAGGRIPLIIGRGLTAKAREALGLAAVHAVPPAASACRHRQGLHPGTEDGRPRLRPARRAWAWCPARTANPA